ncbi:MAG TPA: DUF1569 domain-containing protein [Mucilaginibacter sp.]|jgi:hypothetical protein|nr:DUF1569 domain-containing protein [Mucilaginibacter sp.]
MKTIFDKTTRGALISRINTLNENSRAQWGKMNVYQMMVHCIRWEEMISGDIVCKQAFIGRLFGKMALKGLLKDESPLRRSTPTSPELRVTEIGGDVETEKKKWITLIEQNANSSNPGFIHPFFGKMTKEQVGCLAYKHIDHHLRQFNS